MFPADAPGTGTSRQLDIAGMLVLELSLAGYALATSSGGSVAICAVMAGLAVLGFIAFVAIEKRAQAPLIHLDLLRQDARSRNLLAMGLLTTILMATLVVGPFYLTTALHLGPMATGLVMTIGPAIAALTGVPAGQMVDRFGTAPVIVTGLVGVLVGSALMVLLPALFGAAGYIGSLALITAGYALFQAATTTAVVATAACDQRGVTSALLGLANNLGLITGGSGMGAVLVVGSAGGIQWVGAGADSGM